MAAHIHCDDCYRRECDGVDGCPMMECPNKCNTLHHACKQDEHEAFFCPSAVVPCINSGYGCPVNMARSKLNSHLEHCPASVVICSHEWNRYQDSSADKSVETVQTTPGSSDDKNGGDGGALDVALAQRDQKRLDEALKMPRELRKSLCNTFTSVFPAVPFTQRSVSNAEEEENGMEESTDSLDKLFSSMDAENQCDHMPPGCSSKAYQPVNCSLCKCRSERQGNGLASSIQTALANISASNQGKPVESSESQQPTIQSDSSSSDAHTAAKPQVQLDMEMFNSFRSKPASMLTFLCAQDFRRDQFAQHYKNAHCEIQAGLNGWGQIRCPLSAYGCRHTTQRFLTARNERVIYDPCNESFTTVPLSEVPVIHQPGTEWLSTLPHEVLYLILSSLDSQSLRNLSLTSKSIRDLCSTLLTRRGIVVYDWKRNEDRKWIIQQRVWSFTTAFSYIDGWKFADVDPISSHLSTCPFFIAEMKKEPVRLLP